MGKKIIATDKAPAAIGPYSQAIEAGGFIFASGQIPVDPATGNIPDGIEAQAKQALTNVKNLMEASGLSMDNIVKTSVFIKDMNDFAKVNEVYATFFESDFPARSCVEVARLPKDVLIEVEVIAAR
ncbi:MAG: RidA family protein [Lachnospiraceae bacterium]|nr:RidA family protein [Lachnospiraceae bacterium]